MLVRWQSGRARLRAVLHPLVGRHLPRELRAEQVGRLAFWPEGVRSDEFVSLINRIDTGPIHHGDQIEVFHEGAIAMAAVYAAIQAATEEILVESYILKDDGTGHGLLAQLARAAARGVKVRVLADAAGSWFTRRKFWRQMAGHGIETRLYHPLFQHFFDLLLRDHRKIIVVDRRVCFTGGMNVGDEYSAKRCGAKVETWRDTHARIEGATAWEMAVVFEEGWTKAGGGTLQLPEYSPSDPSGAKTLVLDSRSGRGHAETAAVLAATMAATRQRLWVANAYFAPHPRVVAHLLAAARRGVDVRLLLPGRSDMPLVRRAAHGYYAELLAGGVRIFEYQPVVMHAKTLLADDWASMIGSSNLDYRSYYFNAECNVLILDEATGRGMAATFLQDLQVSAEIKADDWQRRSLFKKCGDALARSLSPLL
jgi:cardiolipin synthase